MLDFIGNPRAGVALYLDNQPLLSENNLDVAVVGVTEVDVNKVDVKELIAINGNHWRKIFSIYAKLCTNGDWRDYRDYQLLLNSEQICFSNQIACNAKIHIFSGKSCWQRFENVVEQNPDNLQSTECGKLFYKQDKALGLCIFSPYFDYRQFPNALIEQTKLIILSSAVD